MTTSRRSFLRSILVAGASFSILPGAGRVWKASRQSPEAYDIHDLMDLIWKIKEARKREGGSTFFRVSGFPHTRIEEVRIPISIPSQDELLRLFGT